MLARLKTGPVDSKKLNDEDKQGLVKKQKMLKIKHQMLADQLLIKILDKDYRHYVKIIEIL